MKSHTREHQAHFTIFSSSRAPQSRVLLPSDTPQLPSSTSLTPHSPPTASKTNRHSSRHLQDILVGRAGV